MPLGMPADACVPHTACPQSQPSKTTDAAPPSRPHPNPATLPPALQPVDQLTPLEGEERMWDPQEIKNIRWGRLAATVALLVSGGFLLGRGLLLRSAALGPAGQQLAAAGAGATGPAAAAAARPAPALLLSRAEAARVVAQWQAAKARALGPQHDIKGLSSILRGEVLQQWRERAKQIQGKGW